MSWNGSFLPSSPRADCEESGEGVDGVDAEVAQERHVQNRSVKANSAGFHALQIAAVALDRLESPGTDAAGSRRQHPDSSDHLRRFVVTELVVFQLELSRC